MSFFSDRTLSFIVGELAARSLETLVVAAEDDEPERAELRGVDNDVVAELEVEVVEERLVFELVAVRGQDLGCCFREGVLDEEGTGW